MRRMPAIAALALLLPTIAACHMSSVRSESGQAVPASGTGNVRTFAASGFSAVELSGADDVDVRVGPGFYVRAEGPSDELDKLDIRRDGDMLRVGRTPNSGWSWGSHSKVKVFVTLPALHGASVAGSGDMTVDRVTGASFNGTVAGSGSLSVAALAVGATDISMAGSGDLAAAGTTGHLSVSIAGSGDIDAEKLQANSADVSIAGSGDVHADVQGAAKVSIMGSGDAYLGAKAQCSVSKMGSGGAHCG